MKGGCWGMTGGGDGGSKTMKNKFVRKRSHCVEHAKRSSLRGHYACQLHSRTKLWAKHFLHVLGFPTVGSALRRFRLLYAPPCIFNLYLTGGLRPPVDLFINIHVCVPPCVGSALHRLRLAWAPPGGGSASCRLRLAYAPPFCMLRLVYSTYA